MFCPVGHLACFFATRPVLSFHFRRPILILSELTSALINARNSRLVLRQSQTLETLLSNGSTSKGLKHLLFCAPRDSHADAHNHQTLRQMVLSWVSGTADSITVGFFCSSSYICFPLEPCKKRLAAGIMLMATEHMHLVHPIVLNRHPI